MFGQEFALSPRPPPHTLHPPLPNPAAPLTTLQPLSPTQLGRGKTERGGEDRAIIGILGFFYSNGAWGGEFPQLLSYMCVKKKVSHNFKSQR